jgi:hypothetical protein
MGLYFFVQYSIEIGIILLFSGYIHVHMARMRAVYRFEEAGYGKLRF